MRLRVLGLAVTLMGLSGCAKETGGTDGGAGAGPDGSGGAGSDGSGGFGGAGFGGAGLEGDVVFTSEDDPILGLYTNETHLYWFTRGTINLVTGVLDHDGKLYRRRIEGGEVELLNDELPVPRYMRLSSEHAYFWLEDRLLEDETWVGRVPLDGGELEAVEGSDSWSSKFMAFEDSYYVFDRADPVGVYEYAPGEERRLVLGVGEDDPLWGFDVDETHLYYQGDGLRRVPLAGGPSELLLEGIVAFAVPREGSRLFGLQGDTETWTGRSGVATMPKAGGPWEPIAELPPPSLDSAFYSPEVKGDRWFAWTARLDGDTYSLFGWFGSLNGGEPQRIPVELFGSSLIALTPHDAFLGSETTIVHAALE